MTSLTVRVDHENNAEEFWSAWREEFPKLIDSDAELYAICKELEKREEVEIVDPKAIERFDAFVHRLPGFANGPAHAREALLFQAN